MRPHSSKNTANQAEKIIRNIVKHANTGELPDGPFKVGQTDISTVKEKWGRPEKISDTKAGLYASFGTKSTTVGYYRHSSIFDLRSYSRDLSTVSLKDVKNVIGQPKQVLSYDNNQVHQQILVYGLKNGLELKWIVERPTAQNQNPEVDHISIYDPEIALHSISAHLNKLTLDEKIGQMILIGMDGESAGSAVKTMIKNRHVGGIILYGSNIKSPDQTVRLTNQLKAINKVANPSLPLFISVDEEGGTVDRMPDPILSMPSSFKIGKQDDLDFTYQAGQILGEASRALGFNMDYAPVLDVIKDPAAAAIGTRAFATDPKVVSRLGAAEMKGIEAKNVIPVLKHFPGYGSVSVDAHKALPTLNEERKYLESHDWLPYKNAIEQGADVIMVTHMKVPALKTAVPSSMSRVIITDILRRELNFDGLIMTDDMTMGAIHNSYSIQTAAVEAVKAGADVVMVAFHEDQQKAAIAALRNAVKNGEIPEQRIDDSVYRILKIKQKYQLSNEPVNLPDVASLNSDIREIRNRIK